MSSAPNVAKQVARPYRSAVSWLVCLFQVLVVVSSFQLSGVGHFGRDLAQVITLGHHHHEGPEDEEDPGHECPPGCPNCHHVHQNGAALQPAPGPSLSPITLDEASAVRARVDDNTPPGPQLPSIYRPPRA